MDRIAQAFRRAGEENRACFIGYLCAGDPDFDTSLRACRALLEEGVDILELGVPFSDPLADGVSNQLAAQRALQSGMTCARTFELVRRVRQFSQAPIVLYTYYNLVFANGVARYVGEAKAAGVDGMLTLDLPPEEAGELLQASREEELRNIFIVAPTTSRERLVKIVCNASGFIYYVSREGVTGVRDELESNIAEAVQRIRQTTDLPVAVGFGISTREQVRQVAAMADAVIVGSVLVNCIRDSLGDPERIESTLRTRAADLAAGVRRG